VEAGAGPCIHGPRWKGQVGPKTSGRKRLSVGAIKLFLFGKGHSNFRKAKNFGLT
jgi:hypothetical protein